MITPKRNTMKILAVFGLGAFAQQRHFGLSPASPPPLGDNAIFVAIETTTRDVINLGGKAEGQCETWLRAFRGHVVFYVDDAAGVRLPPACRQIDAKVRNCCAGNKTLGHSLATAQYKREAVHVAVAASLPPSVRWVVSTEADVWWDSKHLRTYLETLNVKHGSDRPVIAGHRWGPFVVMNRAMILKMGDPSFLAMARAKFLECTRILGKSCAEWQPDLQEYGNPGTYQGAMYNNDHFIEFAARHVAGAVVDYLDLLFLRYENGTLINRKIGNCRFDVARAYHVVFNFPSILPADLGSVLPPDPAWDVRPPQVLAYHHINETSMRVLQRLPPYSAAAKRALCWVGQYD